MPRVWLSLGSNIDRERNIRSAVHRLQATFGPVTLSRVYESEAVGFQGDPFYNLVAGVDTDWEIPQLLALLRRMEDDQGRVRGANKFAPRTLDVDLLTYGDRVIRSGPVVLPREEITRYAFVLLPLAEVAGNERHPPSGRTYREVWAEFDQAGQPLRPVEIDLAAGDHPVVPFDQ